MREINLFSFVIILICNAAYSMDAKSEYDMRPTSAKFAELKNENNCLGNNILPELWPIIDYFHALTAGPRRLDLDLCERFWIAASENDEKRIKELIKLPNLSANIQTSRSEAEPIQTPADWLMVYGNDSLFLFLLQTGIDIWTFKHKAASVRKKYPELPLKRDGSKSYGVIMEAKHNNLNYLLSVLREHRDKIGINLVSLGKTALDWAFEHDNEAMATVLFNCGGHLCHYSVVDFVKKFPNLCKHPSTIHTATTEVATMACLPEPKPEEIEETENRHSRMVSLRRDLFKSCDLRTRLLPQDSAVFQIQNFNVQEFYEWAKTIIDEDQARLLKAELVDGNAFYLILAYDELASLGLSDDSIAKLYTAGCESLGVQG